MKQRLITGWNFQRVLFLIMGTTILVQSVIEKQWMGILFGIYFASMGLFNFGCASGQCLGGSCTTTTPKKEEPKNITFNEIK